MGLLIVSGTAAPSAAIIGRRTLWLTLGFLVPAAAVAGGLGVLPLWRETPFLALGVTGVATSFVAIGVVLLAEPGQAGPGWAMILAAVLAIVGWANEWAVGPLPLASKVAGDLWLVVGGWALYRYPNRRLSPGDLWLFRLMLIWFVGTSWLLVFLSRPEWHDFSPGWWPSLFPNQRGYHLATQLVDIGTVGMAALYVSRWIIRLRHASPAERRLKTPTGIAAIVAVCMAAGAPIAHIFRAGDHVVDVLYMIGPLATLAIPAAFLVAVVRRYLARTAIVQLLLQVTRGSSTAQITAELRTAFADQELQVLYWSDDELAYFGESARPVHEPDLATDQLVVDIRSSDNKPLALMTADSAVGHDPDLVEAAAEAVRLSMENALLLERVEAQYRDLGQASAREAQASAAERRRIQHDLHDGIQGRLSGLALGLVAAIENTSDERTATHLADIRHDLVATITDLRKLAAGIRPEILNFGLATAVEEVVRQHGLAGDIDLPGDTFSDAVQQGAYLVISESVTNVVKHAQTTKVDVRGQVENGMLVIHVTDHGVGGAAQNAGTGWRSMNDRIAALNGRLEIGTPDQGGTRVTMRIPCA